MSVEPADVKAAEDLSLNALSYSAGFCTVEDVTSRLALALAAAREEGRRAEREAAVRWLWEQWDQHEHSHPAVCIERGDHLRALTPEGKR